MARDGHEHDITWPP
jgi:hypothetical protein